MIKLGDIVIFFELTFESEMKRIAPKNLKTFA